MLATINRLHERVNRLVNLLLFQNRCRQLLDERGINSRQYTIVSQLLGQGSPATLPELRQSPWYASLYLRLNDKTRSRDLKKLSDLGLIRIDAARRLWLGGIQPAISSPNPGGAP